MAHGLKAKKMPIEKKIEILGAPILFHVSYSLLPMHLYSNIIHL